MLNFFKFLFFVFLLDHSMVYGQLKLKSPSLQKPADWISPELLERPACRDFLKYSTEEMNTTALIVAKAGEAQIELYRQGADRKTKTKVWSISKFLTGLMLGAQVRDRSEKMGLLDTPIFGLGFARVAQKEDEVDSNLWKQVTIRNLWNNSSGLNWCEYANCRAVDGASMIYGKGNKDAVSYVLNTPMISEPGALYRYSAGNFVLLQAVMKRLVGGKDYLNLPYESVLKYLGIPKDDYAFEVDGKGIFMGGSGLSLSPVAFAKLGQLLLNKGLWDKGTGKTFQVIPKDFFAEMTRNSDPIINSPPDVQNWEGPTGSSIWLNDDRGGIPPFMPTSPWDMIYAGGNYGQFLLVYPSSDLVVARMGGDSPHSQHWKPFSEKAIACFDPSQLREDIEGEEKVPPETGKKLGLGRIAKERIIPNVRAQELCSCLFVSGFPDIETCEKVVPTKQGLFLHLNSHNVVGKPVVDWENKKVYITRKLPFKKASASGLNTERPELGCRLLKPVPNKIVRELRRKNRSSGD